MGVRDVSTSTQQVTGGASIWQQNRQVLDQLAQALQSGNLPAAQQTFSNLTVNQNAMSDNSPLGKLGNALQSGNINAASQLFSALQPNYAQGNQNNDYRLPDRSTFHVTA